MRTPAPPESITGVPFLGTSRSHVAIDGGWTPVGIGTDTAAVAERDGLGTDVRVAVWPARRLAAALGAVDAELDRLDRTASRFRDDSEISRIHQAGGGRHQVSPDLAEAAGLALAAARWTGGLVDPTVGAAIIRLGYDRDFAIVGAEPAAGGPGDPPQAGSVPGGEPALVPGSGPAPVPGWEPAPVPGWESVRLDGSWLTVPPGVRLDLGATAKALGSDRAAAAAWRAAGEGGVLVGLGGDIAIAGEPPAGGWPIMVADSSSPVARAGAGAGPGRAACQLVRLAAGALATSSVTTRQWRHRGQPVHHIVDPRTGRPASGPWRTVSVIASSCAQANAAATAAIVAGESARAWLSARGLPGPAGHPRRRSSPAERLARGRRRATAMTGSPGLWLVSRGSGLVLLVLFTAVIVMGVATRTGASRARWPRFAVAELHRTLSLFAVALLGLHVLTAILDPYVRIGWAATAVPFLSPYRTMAIALGTLAVDAGGAVLLTSALRRRLGYRTWRAVHWLAYLAWPAAFMHSVSAGNDLHVAWVASIEGASAAAVAAAVLVRLRGARGRPRVHGHRPRVAAPGSGDRYADVTR